MHTRRPGIRDVEHRQNGPLRSISYDTDSVSSRKTIDFKICHWYVLANNSTVSITFFLFAIDYGHGIPQAVRRPAIMICAVVAINMCECLK